MTVITITTVGFQEIHPLSSEGKIFTIFLVGSILFVVTYTVSHFVDTLAEGKWKEYLQRREIDATREELLKEAHVEDAKGLLALVGNDPDNV